MWRLIIFSAFFYTGMGFIESRAQNPDIKMIFVKGGTFAMGCVSEQDEYCSKDERPVHKVTVNDFYIGKYEVTQSEWNAVMHNNPSYFTLAPTSLGNMQILMDAVNKLNKTNYAIPTEAEWEKASVIDYLPVEQVSWNDVQEFIRRLNEITGLAYRLPTEAEWEYAARGGILNQGYAYSGSYDVGEVAWYGENSGGKTHLVGTKKPNELGIYDMSGNVGEWTEDSFTSYTHSSQNNPHIHLPGIDIVYRGGGWYCGPPIVRIPIRMYTQPTVRQSYIGFRLARSK